MGLIIRKEEEKVDFFDVNVVVLLVMNVGLNIIEIYKVTKRNI